MTTEPIKTVDRGEFVEFWYCHQPATYRVRRQEWHNNYTERHIYQVDPRP